MKRLPREYGKPRKRAKGLTSEALAEDRYTFMACALGASTPELSSRDTAPAAGERSWPSLEPLRTTPEFSRKLPASAGELDNPVSPSWHGLAVRLPRRPGQWGQHHAPTGSFLGRLNQEFPQRDIDVDIVEFEVEGGLHVGGADDARCSVVLRPSCLSPSRSARVILIRRWQPGMAHLTGILLGIPQCYNDGSRQGFRACVQSVKRQLYLRRLHAGEA